MSSIQQRRNAPRGLLDRLLDRLNVERSNTPHVHHLHLDPILPLEDLCRLQAQTNHTRVRYDRHVLSNALDLGLSDREEEVLGLGLLRNGECLTVENLILEEHDGVRVADRRLVRYERRSSGKGKKLTFNRPRQSSALYGETTLSPGIAPYHAMPRQSSSDQASGTDRRSPASAALQHQRPRRWLLGTRLDTGRCCAGVSTSRRV